MEKFYRAQKDSRLHKDYMEYRSCREKSIEIARGIFERHGVETKNFALAGWCLAIKPTDNDRIKFSAQLKKKAAKDGFVDFKKSSPICKEWLELSKDLTFPIKPSRVMWVYFKDSGRMWTRLFSLDGVVYCSVEAQGDIEPDDALEEIKGSEFFRVIEEYEERAGNGA